MQTNPEEVMKTLQLHGIASIGGAHAVHWLYITEVEH